MRQGRFVALLLVVALVGAPIGTAPFCPANGAGGMDCCKSPSRCGTGMKKADCCRFEPPSPNPQPTAIQAAPIAKGFKDCQVLASLSLDGGEVADGPPGGQAPTPPTPPPLVSSSPLFLLHGALLC